MKSVIHIVTPIVTRGVRTLDDVEPFKRPDLEIRHSLLDSGPVSIESEFDEALSVPDTIRKAVDAEREGANAIIIDCMGDPGLNACREAVSALVIGPSQASMHMAALLGHRFSFITVLERLRPMIANLAAQYGLTQSYASFEAVDIPVLDIEGNLDKVTDSLIECGLRAVKQAHAGALILGCTGFLGCADAMSKALSEAGFRVPVIDPIPLSVHLADALLKSGMSHSKTVYASPSSKPLVGFDIQL